MSLMINQNITSLNAWRNLGKTDREMSKTMEKLSSGLRINKAADDPSGLIISEQMRAQVVGLKAAIKNSEKGISMIQTAEAALDKMHGLLDKMRGLALDSANNATADDNMLAANQAEIDNILATITRISENTQYGTKKLLNGDNANGSTVTSAGGTGIATTDITDVTGLDDGIYNLAIAVNTAGDAIITDGGTALDYDGTTTADGAAASATLSEGEHTVVLTETAAAFAAATAGATNNVASATATSGGTNAATAHKTYVIEITTGDTLDGTAAALRYRVSTDGGATWDLEGQQAATATGGGAAVTIAGADGLTLAFSGDNTSTLAAGDTFTVVGTAASVSASMDGGAITTAFSDTWANVQLTSGLADGGYANFDLTGGTVSAGTATIEVTKTTYDATLTEAVTGTSGTEVTGFKASEGVQEFTVDSSKSLSVNMTNLSAAGTIQFTNADDSLVFQVGANQGQTVKIAIQDVSADMLATNVTQINDSGFVSLANIEINTAEKATDAIALIDAAIDQVSVIRGDLGAFQANTLEANLDSLRVAAENLQASESVIRDTDMAAEMATFTKYQIMMQAGTSMLAQANQMPQNILQLLQG